MAVRSAFCFIALIAFTTCTWGAAKTASKPSAKPALKSASKPSPRVVKTLHKTPLKPAPVLRGKTEILTCRDGTEDRHARIAVVLVGGKTDSFAYYSKWKPRTCSIYLQRQRDPYSKWTDKGAVTNVDLERGLFLIEHRKDEYRFVFRDVDRERYCGMDGTINGSLTIRKGTERCELIGVMDEGIALGQAQAHAGQNASPASPAASTVASDAAPARQFVQRSRREREQVWPRAAAAISD
jgi:hypothetical protein